MPAKLPDYYALLELPVNASQDQIKQAYKQKALQHHPDRNGGSAGAKIKFQFISDAYSTLHDPAKRRQYDLDRQRQLDNLYNPLQEPSFSQPAGTDANAIFGSVFEEMLRDEMHQAGYFWQPMGAASGAVIGFIIANIPGAIAGYAAGGYLGKVRDQRGKAVIEVFQELPGDKKTAILAALAAKLFSAGVKGSF